MKYKKQTSLVSICLIAWLFVFAGLLECKASYITFNPQTKYRILCSLYNKGGLSIGSEHNKSTPLYYWTLSDNEEDMFWYIKEVAPGRFLIQNAKTNHYITYDGIRTGSLRRYVDVTTEIKGDSSLWNIKTNSAGNAYMISSVLDVAEAFFNVRSSFVVGTYSESESDNEYFTFCDENGNNYQPIERDETKFGTTLDGFYWENVGLTMPVAVSSDVKDPITYYIKNVRSGKYVLYDSNDMCLSQSEEPVTKFYFVQGKDGLNIYTTDGVYLNGLVPSIGAKNVKADEGLSSTDDHLWQISYASLNTNPGYGIGVAYSSENGDNNNYVWKDQVYWNDLGHQNICYYSVDNGSTFLFYSKDKRHQNYLASYSIFVPDAGTSESRDDVLNVIDRILINKKPAVYDKKYKTFLMPISDSYRKTKKLTATIESESNDGNNYEIRIDGNPLSSDETYLFDQTDGTQTYVFSFYHNDKKVGDVNLSFTYLPIVELNGYSFSSTYHPGSLRVNDGNILIGVDSLYNANIRYRGATAMNRTKKSYAIKLKDASGNSIDRSFIGLREDNNWILDAMAIDAGRMRNRVATDLWNDFSTPPYQKAFEKKAINGTRGKFVEVLLNGYYAGIYCMTEKVDRKQLKLKKIHQGITEDVADTVRGTLYKSSEWTYETFMGHYSDKDSYPMTSVSDYNNNSDTWCSWECKYPDLGDGESIDWGPLYRAANIVAAEGRVNFESKVSEYFDLPVYLDYFLFIELMLATDNHGKNMYIYNYDQTKYNKVSLAPWDLDGTFGRRWNGSTNITGNAKQDFVSFLWAYEHGEYTIFKRLKDYNYDNWNEKLAERYAYLRSRDFGHDSLLHRFSNYRELFKESGADQREITRWQGIDGITMDFDNEISFLDTWLADRLAFLDTKYNYTPIPASIKSHQADFFGVAGGKGQIVVNVQRPTTVYVYTIGATLVVKKEIGVGVSVIDGIAPGVYIVNNKKVIVR